MMRSYQSPVPFYGLATIGEAIKQFQEVGTMTADTRYCIESGDVALASAAWRIKGVDADGEPVEANGQSADLFRRQGDVSWLLVVDNPFGGS
jgi:ketosteroid isomerase-like protein